MCRDMVFQVLSDYLKRHVYVWQHRDVDEQFWTIVQLLTAEEELHKTGDISSVVSLWLRIGTV